MQRQMLKSLPGLGIIALMSGMLAPQVSAQQVVVHGKVVDSKGEPIIGVNVVEKGTTNGIITDINGGYMLKTKGKKAVLQFSYIGYLTQNITVGSQKKIDVTLKEDSEQLEEVVVIGYGTAKKKDLTGAISTIKTEELAAEAPASVQDMMRANSPGLNIGLSTNAKGDPGMQIRGKNTLKAGSSPLIVLDGVIYEGSMSDINPMDVESIDVLKDASSAAVYGAKAANGVIVVTTKKGKAGKPVINFNTNIGMVQVANPRKVLTPDQFIQWRKDYEITRHSDDYNVQYPEMFSDPRSLQGVDQLTWYNYDQATPATATPTEDAMMRSWLARLDLKDPEIENYMNGRITDWQDLVFQNGLQQDYTASISNRSDNFQYYWSMGYADREGITTDERYTTFRTRLNLESKVTDFLSVGLNSSFTTKDESDMGLTAWGQMTNISPYGSNNIDDPNSPEELKVFPTGDVTPHNPFYDSRFRDKRNISNALNANIYAKVTLPFGIKYQMNFIPYYRWNEAYQHNSSQHKEWAANGGSASRSTNKTFNWQIDNVLSWEKEFNNQHNIAVTLLANAEKGQYWSQTAKTSNFSPSDILGYHRLQAGTVPLVDSNDTYKTGDALMARVFYSFKNRYMITTSVRRDGYSAFGKENPRATFPSVALGWTFSQEKFLEPASSWLNYGKLRVSWGQNGNRSIGQYEALSDLTSGLHPYIDQSGNLYTSSQLYVNRMSNHALKWERTEAVNIGIDYSLFNDIISGAIETYFSKTNDLLVDRSLPEITGFNSVASNLGQIKNKGFEFSINAHIINNKNFTWDASGNFSLNRRKVAHLYGDMVDIKDAEGNVIGQKEADDIGNRWFIGHDPDEIWEYKRDGVWQIGEEEQAAVYGCQPGDFKYIDQNEDGVMTNDDRVFQGFRTPRFRWTLRNEFTFYKNFSFSFLFYSYWGQKRNFMDAANCHSFPDRTTDYAQPYWTPENPLNDFARIGSKKTGQNYISGSFIRLDNITLSYNVPTDFLKKFKIQGMRISGSIRNVCDFAPDWKYWDPETGSPTPRTYNLGINFTL